ncbi:hypothetical protein BGZ76_011144 [Entomortierella beljakovae]|nr:hypothetical protein BGZ76_011144 [Entomortierella beljakovae]
MDDLDFDPGYDEYHRPKLTPSSSSSSLYQLEQSYLQGVPCMTTMLTTTTVTTTTTTTTADSTATSPTNSPVIQALPIVEELAIGDTLYLEEQNKEETPIPRLNFVSDGLYLFVFEVPVSLYYPIRALILFILGFAFSVVIDHIQTQHSLVRCFGGFIGVIYAASKLLWTSSLQTSFTLVLISVGLWFWFDRTLHGFMISFAVAFSGTIVSSVLLRE